MRLIEKKWKTAYWQLFLEYYKRRPKIQWQIDVIITSLRVFLNFRSVNESTIWIINPLTFFNSTFCLKCEWVNKFFKDVLKEIVKHLNEFNEWKVDFCISVLIQRPVSILPMTHSSIKRVFEIQILLLRYNFFASSKII